MAWDVLVRATPDEAFVPVLLGDLLNHPDEHVRSSSANALEQPVGSPDVQEALERALNDPSMDVRRAASGVLERAGR